MKCIVGLGNPGPKYAGTRHNIGCMVIVGIARWFGQSFKEHGFSDIAVCRQRDGDNIILARPGTYMNRSGFAVAELKEDFGIEQQDLLIIYDDMDIPFGKIRLRSKGGPAGHRGLTSIIDATGDENFPRLRVGIGRPEPGVEAADYVLQDFHPREHEVLHEVIDLAREAAVDVINRGIEWSMCKYNGVNLMEDGEN